MIPRILLRFLLFLLPMSLMARADFQLWLEGQKIFPLKKIFSFEWRYAFRVDEGANRFHYIYQQGRVISKIGENWGIAPGYRQAFLLDEAERWRPLYQPIFDSFVTGKFWKFEWEYRNRFQYLSREERWENRNRFWVRGPRMWGTLFRLVFYEELFYELFKKLIQQRHYFSLELDMRDDFQVRVGYLLRYTRFERDWRQQNILYFEAYSSF